MILCVEESQADQALTLLNEGNIAAFKVGTIRQKADATAESVVYV